MPLPRRFAGMTAVKLAAGGSHTCAIRNDGKLVCWGSNGNGELGVGSQTDVGSSTGQMGDNLVPVDLGTGNILSRFANMIYSYLASVLAPLIDRPKCEHGCRGEHAYLCHKKQWASGLLGR
jgi:hypothetical protein